MSIKALRRIRHNGRRYGPHQPAGEVIRDATPAEEAALIEAGAAEAIPEARKVNQFAPPPDPGGDDLTAEQIVMLHALPAVEHIDKLTSVLVLQDVLEAEGERERPRKMVMEAARARLAIIQAPPPPREGEQA